MGVCFDTKPLPFRQDIAFSVELFDIAPPIGEKCPIRLALVLALISVDQSKHRLARDQDIFANRHFYAIAIETYISRAALDYFQPPSPYLLY
jgi:hypothetical protein